MLQTDHRRYYSDDSFWKKVRSTARQAGDELIRKAFELYYTARADGTPIAIKTAIYSALGYFILPLDAIPDVVPVAGFTDDLGAVGIALALAARYITPEVRQKARDQYKSWFGGRTKRAEEPEPSVT